LFFSEHWDCERRWLIDRIILRVALAEVRYFPDVPANVIIDEAIEIAVDNRRIAGTLVTPATVLPGVLFVPIAQPKARLLMAMLEPQAPDSLLAWGEFNNSFEQKEYMEPYVAEEVAREQLAKDPALAREFAERLRSDAAFAADPQARLDFFYRRHSAWDERYRLYPVLRTDVEPPR